MGSKQGICAVALFAFCSVLTRHAFANDPTAAEKETARAMMDAGLARRDAGDHQGALQQFRGADAIMHVPTTGIETAREQVALGELVEARETLGRLLRMPEAAGEPTVFASARKKAQALDDELSGRIPSLRIHVSGATDGPPIEVTVDSTAIPVDALISPLKVNPGRHVIIAVAGSTRVQREIEVLEGRAVEVILPIPTVAPPPDPSPLSRQAAPVPSDVAPAATLSAVPWLRWGGFGVAAAGLIVGSVTGAMSLSSTNQANKGCVHDSCPPSTWSDIDSARTTATISTVAFVAAGVGAVVGLASFLLSDSPAPPAEKEAKTRRRVSPWIGVGGAGITGAF